MFAGEGAGGRVQSDEATCSYLSTAHPWDQKVCSTREDISVHFVLFLQHLQECMAQN